MRPVLYQFWRSTASWRVRWALAIKGVDVEVVNVDLLSGEHTRPEHLARNPMGRVPVLCIDGRHLGESVAIVEYLEELVPDPSLFPRDPWLRARTRQLVELVNSEIQPLQIARVRERHSSEAPEQSAWVHEFASSGLAACEELLATIAKELNVTGPFALGDRLTAADLFLVPQIGHSRRAGVDLSDFGRLRALEEAALATEHACATAPERQPGAPLPA